MATKIDTNTYFQRYNISEEYLRDAYLTRQLSLPDIETERNIPIHTIITLFKRLGISTRSISDSKKLASSTEKFKQSCLKKYGVENPSQVEDVKNKKKQTFITHYGVDNVWKSDWFQKQINGIMMAKYGVLRRTNGEKVSQTLLSKTEDENADALIKRKHTNKERYGIEFPNSSPKNIAVSSNRQKMFWENLTDEAREELISKFKLAKTNPEWKALKKTQNIEYWNSLSDDEKQLRLKKLHSGIKYVSSLETRINQIFSSWRSIDKKFEYKHLFYIGHRNYDFLIHKKLLLEVQGDYWHANPTIYNHTDVIDMGNTKMTAAEVWERDTIKKKIAVDNGFTIVYIWENEMRQLSDEDLEQLLISRLNI